MGWSPQVPTHRAVERIEEAVARWQDTAGQGDGGRDRAGS
ncbi:winged helix-turn-helix domain-containing protein [Streptomyces sp. MUM 203J]|nr:winged helix-turn-helix domain-containing protein [Streptomyces sp. MUM 203J]